MLCPNCLKIIQGSSFCVVDGGKLVDYRCPTCKYAYNEGEKYCKNCGTLIPSKEEVLGLKKEVTNGK